MEYQDEDVSLLNNEDESQEDAAARKGAGVDEMEDVEEEERNLCSPIGASQIKLKQPAPGSKIDNLKKQIEQQVTP